MGLPGTPSAFANGMALTNLDFGDNGAMDWTTMPWTMLPIQLASLEGLAHSLQVSACTVF